MDSKTYRPNRRQIAASTLDDIKKGLYTFDSTSYDLTSNIEYMKEHTVFYPPESALLSEWSTDNPQPSTRTSCPSQISILEVSTLVGARRLRSEVDQTVSDEQEARVGVLNFASAKNPGGGFLTGAQAQEESLARSSTLYPSLMTPTAQQFYRMHKRDPKAGYYSHAMIYSPRVLLFRNDDGDFQEPIEVDIVVSAAVNAGVVRRSLENDDETGIAVAMKERMGRILLLFESQGVKNLVLGSFGTGVFRNKVDVVATIWAELLVVEGARFRDSFDRVMFAILDGKTLSTFNTAFEARRQRN